MSPIFKFRTYHNMTFLVRILLMAPLETLSVADTGSNLFAAQRKVEFRLNKEDPMDTNQSSQVQKLSRLFNDQHYFLSTTLRVISFVDEADGHKVKLRNQKN